MSSVPRAIVTTHPNAVHGTPSSPDARHAARSRAAAHEQAVVLHMHAKVGASTFAPAGDGSLKRLLGQVAACAPSAAASLAAQHAGASALAQRLVGESGMPAITRGMCFEDLVAAVMIKVVEDEQKKITELMGRLGATTAPAPAPASATGLSSTPTPAPSSTPPSSTPPSSTPPSSTPSMTLQVTPAPPRPASAPDKAAAAAPTPPAGIDASAADSRQILFEQLKNEMNKLQQMQQALSNVLSTMHSGAMNSIRNIRA